jgi:hypothetical protein
LVGHFAGADDTHEGLDVLRHDRGGPESAAARRETTRQCVGRALTVALSEAVHRRAGTSLGRFI